MTTKTDFNAEEWAQVAGAPAIAGFIVATAQKGGTIRETMAMGKAYAEAKKEHGDSDLLGEIVATSPQPDLKGIESKDELRIEGLAKLRQAVELLQSKATPEEVDDYRAFTLTVAQRAAEADKSGGVLGVGGERVTDAEREALAAVAEALGTQPPELPAE
jgi:hypothetical protein